MTNSFDRLKQQRKKVPPRSSSLDQENFSTVETPKDLSGIRDSNSNDSNTDFSQLVSESGSISEPVRRTIRLDPATDKLINSICQENKITRETLFEATVSVCTQNQKTMGKVINEAKRRYGDRKKAGEIKKIKTMSRKYD